jgi:histone acetyltransferase MYST1
MLEDKPGGPERPLSDLGHKTYVSFWTIRVVKVLLDLEESEKEITINAIRDRTGMTPQDIMYILNNQKILRENTLNCDRSFLLNILKLAEKGKPGRPMKMSEIRWKPYKPIL